MMSFGLFGLFTAGLLTFLTPCVLPLIPIYLSALIGGDIRSANISQRGQLMWRALLFSIGFISVFTLLGLTASTIGTLFIEHKGVVQAAGALLILAFGLKFLGLINIPFFDRIVRADDTKMQTRFGSINALVMGVVFAAGWSPCVGPVLGSVLTYTASTTSDPLTGAVYLTVYGTGFAIPLLITAVFAEAGVKLLKKINPYLPKIERAIGILLVFVAGSLLFDLANATTFDPAQAEANAKTITELSITESGESWPVMVEFYSKDCTICKKMKPIIDSITTVCDGNSVLVKQIDITESSNKHMVGHFKLVGLPTFVFLDDKGNEAARLVGEQTEQTLKQALSVLRGKPCPGLGIIPEQYMHDYPEDQSSDSCDTDVASQSEEPQDCDT